jgi:hypothetical protein
MPKIIVTKPFLYAHRGHQVQAFEADRKPVDVGDDVAQLALAEGWARKASAAAPANKDAAGARSNKAAGDDADDEDDGATGGTPAGGTDTQEAP